MERRTELAVGGHVLKYAGWVRDLVVLAVNLVFEVVAGGLEMRLTIDLGDWFPSSGIVLEVFVDVLIAVPAEVVAEVVVLIEAMRQILTDRIATSTAISIEA